jgi:hypothetical protein
MLQANSSPAAEGRSPPPVRCTTVKKSSYTQLACSSSRYPAVTECVQQLNAVSRSEFT